MNILRKFGLLVFSLLLFIVLPLHTFAWTTKQTLLDRNVVLGWLKEGKVYDNIADTAAQLAEDSLSKKDENQQTDGTSQEGGGQMPDTATLIKAAKVALPANVLQQNVEAIINSAYDWLEGKTDTIVLNLDLSDEKKAFIDALGNEAITRAASLPTCTAEQVGDFDPLSSNCIPSGTNVATQAEKIKKELANSKDFLPDTTVTTADLTVGEEGSKKLISEQFNFVPNSFKNAKNSSIAMTISVFVLAILVFLLGKTRRSGLKINAWIFGLAGLWALFLGLAFKLGNSAIVNQLLKNSEANLGTSALATLMAQVSTTLFTWHFIIGGSYLGVAILCIVGIKLMGKKNYSKSPKNSMGISPNTSNTSSQTTQKPKTTNNMSKPQNQTAKRTNLVQ